MCCEVKFCFTSVLWWLRWLYIKLYAIRWVDLIRLFFEEKLTREWHNFLCRPFCSIVKPTVATEKCLEIHNLSGEVRRKLIFCQNFSGMYQRVARMILVSLLGKLSDHEMGIAKNVDICFLGFFGMCKAGCHKTIYFSRLQMSFEKKLKRNSAKFIVYDFSLKLLKNARGSTKTTVFPVNFSGSRHYHESFCNWNFWNFLVLANERAHKNLCEKIWCHTNCLKCPLRNLLVVRNLLLF